MDKSKIISITDIIENKVRKQRELDDYNARLEELQRQKFWLEKEIQMAEFIIAAVQSEISPKAFVQAIIDWSPLIFSGGLQIALPLIITMLLVNIGLGIVTRSAPSLNIIAVGFPAIILVGMVLLTLALPGIIQLIQEFWLNALDQLDLILVN